MEEPRAHGGAPSDGWWSNGNDEDGAGAGQGEWELRAGSTAMARRVYLHIGLPKTGTTYLQTLMWNNREVLAGQGVLLPGDSRRQHLWASCAVREDPNLVRRSPEAPAAWDRLTGELNGWDGTAVVSHEPPRAPSR